MASKHGCAAGLRVGRVYANSTWDRSPNPKRLQANVKRTAKASGRGDLLPLMREVKECAPMRVCVRTRTEACAGGQDISLL